MGVFASNCTIGSSLRDKSCVEHRAGSISKILDSDENPVFYGLLGGTSPTRPESKSAHDRFHDASALLLGGPFCDDFGPEFALRISLLGVAAPGVRRDLKLEAGELAHIMTHKPVNPHCVSCMRGKLRQVPHRRGAFERPVEKWGDLLTCDHMVQGD